MGDEPTAGGSGGGRSGRVRRRSWRAKFGDAFRGLKLGVRGHSSFFVHFFLATAVVAAAVTLRMNAAHWSILLGCIGAVIAAELFNSAVELLCRNLEERGISAGKGPLDIAAGAVLAVSITAAAVGLTLFGTRLLELFG